MNIAQKITWFLMVLLVTACSSKFTPMPADPNASAQVTIDETQVMLILGGADGKGMLTMNGEVHAFKIAGIKLGGFGIDKMKMSGNVYNLSKVEDFAGTYFEAEAAATPGKGVGDIWLKNEHGVWMHLKGNSEGLSLGLGITGADIRLL